MIKAIIIDDEQHCIDALLADLTRNCGNVEILAKCTSAKEAVLCIKKLKPGADISRCGNALDEWI